MQSFSKLTHFNKNGVHAVEGKGINFSQLSLRSEILERQVCQKGCEYVLFIFSKYKKSNPYIHAV